jgi:hypothetical protein
MIYPNWLQLNLPREVLSDKYLKISFSQNGEDDYVRAHFWEEILKGFKGTYIDIGCFHETLYSNTKLLSLMGWHGLAIDANPELKDPWLRARPHDQFFNYCIAPSGAVGSDGLEFFRFRDGAMSTANPDRAKQLVSKGWPLIDVVNVPAISLTSLGSYALKKGISRPDFVSIDLELVDFLDDLPKFLQDLQPRLLCIECVTDNVNLGSLFISRECRCLNDAGYEPVGLIGGNIFAVPFRGQDHLAVFG